MIDSGLAYALAAQVAAGLEGEGENAAAALRAIAVMLKQAAPRDDQVLELLAGGEYDPDVLAAPEA